MEKLAYLLMGPPGAIAADVGRSLREVTVPELRRRGAHSVQVNVIDAEFGHPFGVEPAADTDHILAAVFVWVDSAGGSKVASVLPDTGTSGARWHGWLVCEAEPVPNRLHPPDADGRVAGLAQIVALTRPDHMTWGEWRSNWQDRHTPVAVNTQSTFRYVQNVIFRSLTVGAPPFAAIVEECFPAEASSDLHVFFDAAGDDARLARHMAAMSESCDRFMDGVAPVSWTAEWVYG